MSGRFFVIAMGLCQWVYAFILTICVTMSDDQTSPEIQISFADRANSIRTICLLALVILSWVGAYATVRGSRWAWFYTCILALFLLGVGLYGYTSNGGALEAFLATGALRHGTGLVLMTLSAITLALLPLPSIRRQFFNA
jgi:hypothetical protein